MSRVFDRAAAFVACWFPGSEGGHAAAALLTGAAVPSAGLPVTRPRDVGQVPIAYSMRPGGRPEKPDDKYTSKYLDMPNDPQFAFGHGLTYGDLRLSDPEARVDERIRITTIVSNVGARAGAAPALLFIRDPVASVARPAPELLRFERVALEPGESRTLRFDLDRADLAFLGPDLRPRVEPGAVTAHVGFSADPKDLRAARFTLD